MKAKVYISLSVVFIVAGVLWLQQSGERDRAFMDSLLIHQPIELNQVKAIHVWEKDQDIKRVPTDEYIHVVDGFNQYEPNRIASKEVPPSSQAQVVIDTNDGATIVINYVDEKIYVNRNDVGEGLIEYVLLDKEPRLENFFRELIVE
ncbi:hypothetical protein NC661_03605 [Aquibacillus koreensis]|uniref:Uncharacterized protein n=1 Tax=Aquibacillus koreensis TaxID=279446 RepID=A0A9X3WIY4_9BACI|nr:hypothetical protein [Aquibacillus koreensis]MCT2536464.1 hypothetical protein [Aquibacillus koreensis]MDC3419448.1 hypothetical protein [Aquibacillus koreensis]